MKYYGDHIIDDAENRAKTRSPVTKVPKTLKPRTTHARKIRTTQAKVRDADRAGTKTPVVIFNHSSIFGRFKIKIIYITLKVKTTRAPKTMKPKTTRAPKTAAPKTAKPKTKAYP